MVAMVCGAAYDEDIAKRNLYFAGVTYCPVMVPTSDSTLPSWSGFSDECVQRTPDFQITGVYYNKTVDGLALVGVSESEQLIVVSFKGTDPNHMEDVIIDLKNVFSFPDVCTLTAISGKAHAGFCLEYHSLLQTGLLDAVLALNQQYPDFQVLATGHSLGASLAMLMALDLMTGYQIPVSLYTYGQPRTVTSDLALQYYGLLNTMPTAEMYRVTHYRDVIPHVPACKANLEGICQEDDLHGYHSGFQMHYTEDMLTYKSCQPVDGADCNEVLPIAVQDHLFYFGVRVSEVCCPPAIRSVPDLVIEKFGQPDLV